MNNLTRTQKIGLEVLKNNAQKKIFIILKKPFISVMLIKELRKLYGVRTDKAVIERAISNAAARLALRDRDIVNNAIFDKLAIVKQLQSEDFSERPSSDSETVKVNAMIWEVIIIASQAPMSFEKSEDLVNFCLDYSFEQINNLFGCA